MEQFSITKEDLSHEQRELLAAAAADRGQLTVQMSPRAGGRAVCAGRQTFFAINDPQFAVRYLDAVRFLVEQQLLREAGKRDRFELTNGGWELSRVCREL